jgi:PhzF family phenazine biosynthesis protein
MTSLPIYVVDAFAERPFAGNPAAVVPLDAWLPDARLQEIAAENNLSETAFLVPAADRGADYDLRWFTPTVEVKLCGHATLASGFVLMSCLGRADAAVRFASRSGPLAVARDGARYTLDFPARPPQPAEDEAAAVAEALGAAPQAVLQADMRLAVFAREAEVAALAPDIAAVAALNGDGMIATAPGDASGVDFVSRYFAPHAGIAEDPVTGSAHTVLAPFWAERLGKSDLRARQISARGGDLSCQVAGERVYIGGRCRLYLEGRIHV